jgi:hypothetical protein
MTKKNAERAWALSAWMCCGEDYWFGTVSTEGVVLPLVT